MSKNSTIDVFIARMETALAALDAHERSEIVMETRSHLLERTAEGKLDETLQELGEPELYARQFLPEAPDSGTQPPLSALLIRFGVFAVCALLGLLSSAISVSKTMNPEEIGLWLSTEGDFFVLGRFSGSDPAIYDALGPTFLPVFILITAACSIIGYAQLKWLSKNR